MAEAKIKIVIDGQEAVIAVDEVSKKIAEFSEKLKTVDDGSEEFKNLTALIEKLKGALDNLVINVDSEEAVESIAVVEESLQELQDIAEEPVVPEVDTQPAQKSLKELKADLRAAQDEAASSGFGTPEFEASTQKAGELKDQIQDINEAINSQKGESIEKIGSQFRGIADSLSKLDFEEANKKLDTFRQTAGKLDFKGLSKGAFDFAKNLGGTLLSSLQTLGKAILANPLLLLASVVTGIGVALFALKDKFAIVQKAVDATTALVRFLVGALKDLSDTIGLSNFAEQENLEKTTKSYKEKAEAVDKATKQEIALAKARGASTEEISKLEEAAEVARLQRAEQLKESNKEILASIQAKQKAGKELSEAELAQYESLSSAIDDAADATANLQLIYADRLKKAREDADKNEDLASSAREKRIAEEKAYLQQLETLQEKYTLNEEQRIQSRFAKELALIKGNSEKEEELRKAIIKERDKTLLALQSETLNAQLALSEEIALKEAELNKKNLLLVAQSQEERIQIEEDTNKEIFQINLNRLTREKEVSLAAAGDDAEKRKEIELQYQLDVIKITEDANNKKNEILETNYQTQAELANDAVEKERQVISEARDKLLKNVQGGGGILGFKADVAALRANVAAEVAVIDQAQIDAKNKLDQTRNERKLSEKQYQEELLAINKKAAADKKIIIDTSEDEIAAAAKKRLDDQIIIAQAAVSLIQTISQAADDDQKRKLDEQRATLEQDYETRRKIIEDTIKDEAAKTAALKALDNEFAAQRNKLDKQDLELKKRQIKRDRNAALAQIALANAVAISNALVLATKQGATKGDVIAFFAILATTLATVGITIANARKALKDAEAAAGALGAGGGGSDGGTSASPSVGGGASGQNFPPAAPTFGQPLGVNPTNQQFQGEGSGITINPVVSVIDINAAQARVDVSETRNTIGG